jgi:hypothetical protein
MKIGLLLTLISFNSFALDCGDVPEGKVVRLDQGSGSLAKAAVQDQDGIGSCFANQASLLLQTIIPENPNLSYLNLGLYYASDKTIKEKREKGDKTYTRNSIVEGEGVGSAIYTGNTCDTIDAAIARQKATTGGVLCKTEDVALEHSFLKEGNYLDDGDIQEKSLRQASRYMNAYQKTFGNIEDGERRQEQREKADQFKIALNKFVKNSGDAYFSKKCSEASPEVLTTAIENALTRALNDNPQCISGKGLSSASACQNFAQMGEVLAMGGISKSSKFAFIQNNKSRASVKKAVAPLFQIKTGLPDFMKGLSNALAKSDGLTGAPADKEKFAKMIIASISPRDLNNIKSDYDRLALKKMDDCKANNVLGYFKDKKDFLEKAKKDVVLCNYSELLNSASELAGTMPEKAFRNMTGFIDFITDKAGLKYDDAIMSLIANDCSPEKRITLPATLKCESAPIILDSSDFPGNTISGKAVGMIKENRAKIMSNLASNRAVGVDICSKFWATSSYDFHKDSAKSKFNTCANTGTHGFHAVTAIGYRCKNNRIQYLSQNSWGPNWTLPNKEFEIEDGKIWMDEDRMFKNTYQLNYITP